VLHELLAAGVESALRNGTVDAGVLYGPYPEGEFSVRQLQSDRFVVALPRSHRLGRQSRIDLRDLADDYFILPGIETAGTLVDAVLAECAHAGFRPKTGHEITTATLQTTLGLVSAGIGVSLVPSAVQPLARKGVMFRPLRKNQVTVGLALLWRPRNPSPVLRNLLDSLPG
jgi:DNA-binding transcriptional LysR family regulator